ncbi:MAG: hypothetical protein JSW06_07700 [Thermoplasmatales archaeon]|nr:MAG: hypothetical protein JSW06_07700 [Thermoplasmatales archaeon]
MGMPNAFKCHICDRPKKYFDTQDERSTHYSAVHGSQFSPGDAWKCDTCEQDGVKTYFPTCNDLQNHLSSDHE